MPDDLQIRSNGAGKFGLYKGEDLLVANLDSEDVIAFAREQKGSYRISTKNLDDTTIDNVRQALPMDGARRERGRKLLLAPYVNIIRDMIKDKPSISLKEIESRLHGLNIKFSSSTAIVNLLRKFGLHVRG